MSSADPTRLLFVGVTLARPPPCFACLARCARPPPPLPAAVDSRPWLPIVFSSHSKNVCRPAFGTSLVAPFGAGNLICCSPSVRRGCKGTTFFLPAKPEAKKNLALVAGSFPPPSEAGCKGSTQTAPGKKKLIFFLDPVPRFGTGRQRYGAFFWRCKYSVDFFLSTK